ncbi:MAG: 50S ribosomal protein L9 [Deltaproteobacteria bacterium RBG_19FT_COMBO_46_9]|jgi:large subunit ribosomal protein L9|nr:MAG: 50S ribosomal protein L9 [Deltaproteobacteria bacterium RBG_19FT_COMBO_46_9]
MKVILKTDMDSLGLEGSMVNVAKGYARNYLIPNGFAIEATNQNIKLMEMQKKKIDTRRIKAKEDAEKLKLMITDTVVTLTQKVGEEGKLYGSVTTMDIASQLRNSGIDIDRKKILLDKPIRTLGEFDVLIKLHPEVTGSIKVIVAPQE